MLLGGLNVQDSSGSMVIFSGFTSVMICDTYRGFDYPIDSIYTLPWSVVR
jgi:hypothetical protein